MCERDRDTYREIERKRRGKKKGFYSNFSRGQGVRMEIITSIVVCSTADSVIMTKVTQVPAPPVPATTHS